MNSLLTPEDFMKEKPLSLEKKVNILFDDFKSNLQPLFSGNNLNYSPVNEKEYQDNPIFKNDWLKIIINSNKGGSDHNYNLKNKDVIIESLKLCRTWNTYIIYNPKNYEKIGFWFSMYYDTEETKLINYQLIKFSKNVYCSDEEIYKKGDIIVFDKINRIVRPTTEEEITDNLKNKKKF